MIILNPAAGQEDAARTRRLLGGAFAARGASFDLVETTAAGDAAHLARQAVELGYRAVAAAGGDGTIAEVITGLAGSSVPLGIIPRGTGNQLAANLGVPVNLERAVEVITGRRTIPLDLGQLEGGRYFALMAGAGWDAQVMSAATRSLKERWGFGAYFYAGLRASLSLPSALFRITADGEEFEVRAASVIVANVGQLVYNLLPLELRIGPGVSFQDGRLDVCVFAPRTITGAAAILWRVMRKHYVGDDRLIYLQASEIRIESDPPALTQIDGDLAGPTPLVARAVEAGVRVLVP